MKIKLFATQEQPFQYNSLCNEMSEKTEHLPLGDSDPLSRLLYMCRTGNTP